VPTTVAAPGRLSTMTCWPQLSDNFCPISREKKSALPPAGNGTMMRTGLTGKFWAVTVPAKNIASNSAVQINGFFIIIISSDAKVIATGSQFTFSCPDTLATG
jgi:hypothetical protein